MLDPVNPTELKLEHLIEKSNHVLFTAHAMFPFQLIPDRIVIDQTKVTIEQRNILKNEYVHTILLQDITNAEVTYTLSVATLVIVTQDSFMMPFLRKNDAIRAKQIIVGLLIARKEQLNLEDIASEHLADKLAEIGRPAAAAPQ